MIIKFTSEFLQLNWEVEILPNIIIVDTPGDAYSRQQHCVLLRKDFKHYEDFGASLISIAHIVVFELETKGNVFCSMNYDTYCNTMKQLLKL